MKRLILYVLACLLLSSPVLACDTINTFDGACYDHQPVQLAWMGSLGVAASGGGVACGSTSEPAGDIFSEGFETATTGYELTKCGTGDCWTEYADSGSSVTVPKSLIGLGTSENHNCNQGLEVNAGTTIARDNYHYGAGLSGFYAKFSIYISSYSDGAGTPIFCASLTSACNNDVLTKITLYNSSGTYTLKASGATTSDSSNTLSAETWYYVTLYSSDAASDCSIQVGTTYDGSDVMNKTFTCGNIASTIDEITIGVLSASQTAVLVFGYVALDSNNSGSGW